MSDVTTRTDPYEMKFDVGTIKHLGLQMYSTLPPVIGELVANGWDANATKVEITIPDEPINDQTSEIVITDNGDGMSDEDVREKYLRIGRDRREKEESDETPPPLNRKIMGRKGIGKFSAFGIAKEIIVESVKDGKISHFAMNYDELLEKEDERVIELPSLPATGDVDEGTRITLRYITKFKNRRIAIGTIRRGLARRFAVIGQQHNFEVVINGCPISPIDRDLKRLLEKDMDDKPYLWEYENEKIKSDTGWTVSGWIGALNRTTSEDDGIDRGIVLMARGKLVQEPFDFNAVVGQQFALSYLIGELNVEFVDEVEDTIGTTRNSLVWDTEANTALMKWGKKKVNKIAREWAEKRRIDNERLLESNPAYCLFQERADEIGNRRALKIADKLVRQTIEKNPNADIEEFDPLIQMCLDFLEFDAFWEIAAELTETEIEDTGKLINLFREWEIVEAKEMERVTRGRIKAIEKLQKFIETNAREVPTVHNFLKEFPWVLDPHWTLVDDEVWYTDLLNSKFPEGYDKPEVNKRIDFLCVSEGTNLIVVEIKRPQLKASMEDLDQIAEYVSFVRHEIVPTTDPNYRYENVIGYLLCGDLVDTYQVRGRVEMLANSQIYIKRYGDLLSSVRKRHARFLERYNQLRAAKQNATNPSDS